MEKEQLNETVSKMLELKLIELKLELPMITIRDLYNYLVEVILVNNDIRDVNDASFFIMNVKVNKIYEYLNYKDLANKQKDTLQNDLKYILEG